EIGGVEELAQRSSIVGAIEAMCEDVTEMAGGARCDLGTVPANDAPIVIGNGGEPLKMASHDDVRHGIDLRTEAARRRDRFLADEQQLQTRGVAVAEGGLVVICHGGIPAREIST